MDNLAIILFSLLAIPAAIVWLVRRSRVKAGLRCWQCGVDLEPVRRAAGHARVVRCPECGHAIDHEEGDDEPEESPGDDEPFDDEDDEYRPGA